ncbi:hypothetical protein BV20DRAFT_975606 [Pilatotrama ljubarskyi]|nr:hypothetical protein BV20DRAFT_975606 [Pilatotrama ljubarskyi]
MPGLLFVYSDPGSAVSHEEFNDWYDNEHVPLRIPIPGFHSWSRWTAADGKRPTYAAFYDLSSPSIVSESPYADLAHTRSEREKDIIARLGLLDRRTYQLREPVFPPKAGGAYDPAKPGQYVSVVEVDVKPELEDDFNRWYGEEHIPLLAKIPGWLRSRRFVLVEAGASGSEATDTKPPKYLAIHEWADLAAFETPEFKECVETPWTKKTLENAVVFHRRLFKLMRTWERK